MVINKKEKGVEKWGLKKNHKTENDVSLI